MTIDSDVILKRVKSKTTKTTVIKARVSENMRSEIEAIALINDTDISTIVREVLSVFLEDYYSKHPPLPDLDKIR